MSAAAASYLPDCQVIRLRPEFSAFSDPENPRGVHGPNEIGLFFHEWLHYLHNVSTVHGLSAFGNQVLLWTDFRHTTNASGLSAGSEGLAPQHKEIVRQRLVFLEASRKRRQGPIPGGLTDIDRFRILDVLPVVEHLLNGGAEITVLHCRAEVVGSSGESQAFEVRVGVVEILEGLAVLLEGELVRRLGGKPYQADVVPYWLLFALGRARAPSLKMGEVVLCGLTALQSSDPPGELLAIFDCAETSKRTGRDPYTDIRVRTDAILKASSSSLEETLRIIDAAFPVDEPLARAIKRTTAMYRKNFQARRSNPFFEFDVVQQLAQNVQEFNSLIQNYGACCLIQERHGEVDDPCRDLMYDFTLEDHDESLEFGLRKMHASFRFVALHAAPAGFVATSSLTPREATKCPFYTACAYPLRTSDAQVCAKEPWKSATMSTEGHVCWYASAVRDIRLPQR
jgi:hypothetical protein